jgi:hypothetical protein
VIAARRLAIVKETLMELLNNPTRGNFPAASEIQAALALLKEAAATDAGGGLTEKYLAMTATTIRNMTGVVFPSIEVEASTRPDEEAKA